VSFTFRCALIFVDTLFLEVNFNFSQFNCKLKQLQSNGGGEYTSNLFQIFLSQNGIIHRKSCPYTSQQNGLAERKLRHILETRLTLLAHFGLSNKYWVDAFLTSVYIVNHLPTHVLGYSSPYENLFLKTLDYTLLRFFGCKCFPLVRIPPTSLNIALKPVFF
jgi:hypothetical protein